jgi:hypothetical protein
VTSIDQKGFSMLFTKVLGIFTFNFWELINQKEREE